MLKQNLYYGKAKGHIQGILNPCVNKGSVFSKEKTRGIFESELNQDVDLPYVHNNGKVKKDCFFEPENGNREQNLHGGSNGMQFSKLPRVLTGYKNGIKYNTQRRPYLNKYRLKYYQFVIEENLEEDNEEYEAESFSLVNTPESRFKFRPRNQRHSLDV